jgi:putative ATP-binding helicase protein
MKKLLFVMMLAVMGNGFAGTITLQKNKGVQISQEVMESESSKIEKALQRDLQPISKIIFSSAIAEMSKEVEKGNMNLFDKDIKMSSSRKKELEEKYQKKFIDVFISNVSISFSVKKIKFIDENTADVVYDMKMKDLNKGLEALDKILDEDITAIILKKLGYNSEDELDFMEKPGNENEKIRVINIVYDELVNQMEIALKNTTSEIVIEKNIPCILKKVNGEWGLSDELK